MAKTGARPLGHKKSTRVTGTAREELRVELRQKYEDGASIRQLANHKGRSYGFVHRILSEAGVTFRGRDTGGRPRRRRPQVLSPANTR